MDGLDTHKCVWLCDGNSAVLPARYVVFVFGVTQIGPPQSLTLLVCVLQAEPDSSGEPELFHLGAQTQRFVVVCCQAAN